MKPLPLRVRLMAALRLQPMTKTELARCLSCTYSRIEQLTLELRSLGEVRILRSVKAHPKHRPQLVWGLA